MKFLIVLFLSAFTVLAATSTTSNFKGIDADVIMLNEWNLGTVANGGTATLVLGTNVSRATYSGATATIALPTITITTNSYQLIHFGTNTSGGSQIITIPSLLRDDLGGTTLVTTFTVNASSGFRAIFESVAGVWSRVSVSGDALSLGAINLILTEVDLGTIANGGTATLVLSTNVSRAVYSGATATIALPAISITTNSYQLLHFGTNTSGGSLDITIPSLLRGALGGTNLVTTITVNAGAGFRLRFFSLNGIWNNVEASGDIPLTANLPAGTAVTADDLFPMVDDLAGTPTAQNVTAAMIKSFMDNNTPLDISGSAIDTSLGYKVFSKNLTANTTFTFANLTNGHNWTVILTNGASWTATWPTVTWPGSITAPVLDVGAGAVNIYSFLQSGGRTFGSVIQADITTSAGWAGQLTDETGTGLAVFNTNAVLATPTIASFTNAQHTHLNAAGGGTLTSAALVSIPAYLVIAASDETTAITATAGKVTFHMPFAMTLATNGVRASLVTAQASGSIFTVDINDGGTSIMTTTKITIDNTELTSLTAAAAPAITDTALADDAIITIDVDQIGDGTAKGLKIVLFGTTP